MDFPCLVVLGMQTRTRTPNWSGRLIQQVFNVCCCYAIKLMTQPMLQKLLIWSLKHYRPQHNRSYFTPDIHAYSNSKQMSAGHVCSKVHFYDRFLHVEVNCSPGNTVHRETSRPEPTEKDSKACPTVTRKHPQDCWRNTL